MQEEEDRLREEEEQKEREKAEKQRKLDEQAARQAQRMKEIEERQAVRPPKLCIMTCMVFQAAQHLCHVQPQDGLHEGLLLFLGNCMVAICHSAACSTTKVFR